MCEYDLEALAENAQYDLFHNSCSTDHCLNHLYTANLKPAGSMQLRHRGHSFALPTIHLEFNKNLYGRDGRTICGPQCVPKSTDAFSACRKVHRDASG